MLVAFSAVLIFTGRDAAGLGLLGSVVSFASGFMAGRAHEVAEARRRSVSET